MEALIKKVREVSEKNGYNTTDPIEQYFRLVVSLVNYEYAYMNHNEKLQGKTIGELMFYLIVLCDIINIDFNELYEHADTFNYPIEDIDIIRIGALILKIATNSENKNSILDLKNHIIFFIEALVTETRFLPAPLTVKTALEDLLKQIERNEKAGPQDEAYSKYMQNIGMNS